MKLRHRLWIILALVEGAAGVFFFLRVFL